ncbi:MAG: CDP-alcohol phosphatidyltransferase family protein [Candidatus Omnitrophota bacterium]
MISINRVLNRPLTKFFIKLNLHPNYITLLGGSAGILAFFIFCIGTRASFIIGAVFFEFFYILDNCDGEVARAKGLTSVFGSWLDTFTDTLVHVLAFAGIAIGLSRFTQNPILLLAGLAAMIGVFLSSFVAMLQKTRNYGLAIHGMPKAPKGVIKKVGLLDKLIEALSLGDFSIVVVLFALFNKMELLLWLGAFGANLFCVILLIVNFKYLLKAQ